jgi:hypothetical protein
VGVWYPTTARPRPTTLLGPLLMSVAPDGPVSGRNLPLVVISHGNGGGPGSHADLALALADSGYVVAAPMHPGDNYADQGAAGSVSLFSGRNRQLRATVDYMLGTWVGRDHIDPKRIGAFGLSAGNRLPRTPGSCATPSVRESNSILLQALDIFPSWRLAACWRRPRCAPTQASSRKRFIGK